MTDRGSVRGLEYVQCNAEALPFPDASFDLVTIAFGLRNVTDKDAALREMLRVLKVGGQARVLEFSQVQAEWFRPLYDFHSFKVLPQLGKLFAQRRRQLPVPGRIDPQASAAGAAEGDDGGRGLRRAATTRTSTPASSRSTPATGPDRQHTAVSWVNPFMYVQRRRDALAVSVIVRHKFRSATHGGPRRLSSLVAGVSALLPRQADGGGARLHLLPMLVFIGWLLATTAPIPTPAARHVARAGGDSARHARSRCC